jgi:multidrug efflux pump
MVLTSSATPGMKISWPQLMTYAKESKIVGKVESVSAVEADGRTRVVMNLVQVVPYSLRTEGNKFLPAFMLAVVLIFLVLAVQFNSFRDPMVILAGSVPLAMFGALIFTVLKMPNPNMPFWTNGWTTTMNIYAQVGLVTLVGLIAKNGILIVEFANHLQEEGKSKIEAVREATLTRLRPILMTSVATVAGHFPLTLVSGAGAAARNSIGLVLVGGMAIGTIFTLLILPSVYILLARDHSHDRGPAPVGAPRPDPAIPAPAASQ